MRLDPDYPNEELCPAPVWLENLIVAVSFVELAVILYPLWKHLLVDSF